MVRKTLFKRYGNQLLKELTLAFIHYLKLMKKADGVAESWNEITTSAGCVLGTLYSCINDLNIQDVDFLLSKLNESAKNTFTSIRDGSGRQKNSQ